MTNILNTRWIARFCEKEALKYKHKIIEKSKCPERFFTNTWYALLKVESKVINPSMYET